MNIEAGRLRSSLSLLLAAVSVAACAQSSSSPGAGAAGTTGSGHGGSSSAGAAGTTGTSTGNAGTTGTSTGNAGTTGTGTGQAGTTGAAGTTGSGGTGGVPQKDCATKTKLMNPVLLDFENYDGTVTIDKYAEAFGGAMPNMGTAYAGVFGYPDDAARMVTLELKAGHPPSNWAVSETLMQATKWGMGGGVWMACADATAYKGVQFWVRGSAPQGVFAFSVDMESTKLPNAMDMRAGGTCAGTADTCKPAIKDSIPITADWTQVKILWADFTPGMSGTTMVVPNGDNIVDLGWSLLLKFQLDPSVPQDAAGPYIPVPGDLTVNIDDISFIP